MSSGFETKSTGFIFPCRWPWEFRDALPFQAAGFQGGFRRGGLPQPEVPHGYRKTVRVKLIYYDKQGLCVTGVAGSPVADFHFFWCAAGRPFAGW